MSFSNFSFLKADFRSWPSLIFFASSLVFRFDSFGSSSSASSSPSPSYEICSLGVGSGGGGGYGLY